MEFKSFYAGENDDSRRLDKILRVLLPSASLSEIYSLIRKGLIRVNDKKAKSETRVFSSDKIDIPVFIAEKYSASGAVQTMAVGDQTGNISKNKGVSGKAAEFSGGQNSSSSTQDFPFEIVLKNDDLLIINKPYGYSVHGKKDSLDAFVKNYFSKNGNNSLSFSPGPLHRLDERTTGLLAFSWSHKGAVWFSEKIKNHEIKKEYLALVQGTVTKSESWRDYIEKESDPSGDEKNFHTVKASSSRDSSGSKIAETDIYPVKSFIYKNTELSLVRFVIHTGRTHQIRSMSALHGFPLYGDTAYGGKKSEGLGQELFLHAYKLTFPENPFSLPEYIKAPLPENFKKFLNANNCEINELGL